MRKRLNLASDAMVLTNDLRQCCGSLPPNDTRHLLNGGVLGRRALMNFLSTSEYSGPQHIFPTVSADAA